MKIVQVERLIDVGAFSATEKWTIERHITQAIKAIQWPPGSGSFTLYDQPGKARGWILEHWKGEGSKMKNTYYLIGVQGGVEPSAQGPYETEDERDDAARQIRETQEEDDSLFWADVDKQKG